MIVTEEDRLALVAEIAALTAPPRLEEGEITSLMLAESEGITRRQAAYQLDRACEGDSPLLTRREIKHGGRKLNAYRKIVHSVTEPVTNVKGAEPDIDKLEF